MSTFAFVNNTQHHHNEGAANCFRLQVTNH